MSDNQIVIWDEEIKKYAGGEGYGGFLVSDDSGQHLPTKKDGKLSHRLMGAAWAALHGGYRGKKYAGKGKQEAIAKLTRLYKREKLSLPTEKSVAPECFDDTEDGVEISDITLNSVMIGKELRSISDAPRLRIKDAEFCGNCAFFKYAPTGKRCMDELAGCEEVESERMGICEKFDFQPMVSWTCDEHKYFWEEEEPKEEVEEMDEEKALQLKTVTVDIENTKKKLQPIKMIGETRFAGYGCYFSKESKERDLTGTRFIKGTDFGNYYDHADMYYHHGLTKVFDNDRIAKTVKAQVDDVGIWLEGELDRSKVYWTKVKDNIKKGIYYFSGGTAEHLMRYGEDGVIKSFPIIEWSITTTPAEWRLGAAQFYKSIGIDLDDGADSQVDSQGKGDVESRQDQKHEDQKREVKNESEHIKSKETIEMELTPEQLSAQVQAAVKSAIDADKEIRAKAEQEAEAKRKAEEAHQAEIKSAAEQAVAAYKASQPAISEQRPGYGQYKINQRPLGDGFSYVKAIRGIILQARGQDNPWSGAERERDIMVKHANEVRASLAEGVGNLGGYLVPPEYMQDQFIPLLRARAVVRGANPRVLQTKSDIVYIPQQSGGATAYWTGENATLTASNLSFGQLAINIRKLAALEYISNELLADASPSADQLIREDLAAVIALKEDSTFLLSNGVAPNFANAPVGYVNYPGTQQITLEGDGAGNGATIQTKDLFKFKTALMTANVPFDNMAWFCSPRTWDEIAQLKDSQNRYLLETLTGGNISQYPAYGNYPEGPETSYRGSVQGRLFGWPVFVTANITDTNTWGNATTASYLIFSRMPDTIIVERAGLELMATNVAGTAFASDQTWIRGILREGFGVRHAPAVAWAGGVL